MKPNKLFVTQVLLGIALFLNAIVISLMSKHPIIAFLNMMIWFAMYIFLTIFINSYREMARQAIEGWGKSVTAMEEELTKMKEADTSA